MSSSPEQYTAFTGTRRLLSGSPEAVLEAAVAVLHDTGAAEVLVFDDRTGRTVDIDLRSGLPLPRSRNEAAAAQANLRGPGRPRLGVVAREVTLLPRHWEWLGSQPGGASVALRKLVDQARASHAPADRARQAKEATDRFMVAIAGDRPGYEEAARGLYAGNRAKFTDAIAHWPADIRGHALHLAEAAFADPAGADQTATS
ncbi:DUF2239 family protein [Geminicoccus roseus]|uniref:DUF2239 family protein n=1 Tax=Geminicoccus roseus TaxID=404900 RepID=UPI0004285EEB|nr:DUF2239 family protein [Geminicoccus roseus]